MTTSIKILAHCCSDKEVEINYQDNSGPKIKVIQDGEEFETVVYDDFSCSVQEIKKAATIEEPTTNAGGDGKTRPPTG